MNFKKLGVVLSGGGGKGAYQIGVWKALREMGLDTHIAAVAGTSVGALNGAMMVQGCYELAERLWCNVERHNLLTVEGVPGLAQWLAQKIPSAQALIRFTNSVGSKGLFKPDGLQAMISEGVDAQALAGSTIPLTVAWHHGRDNRVEYRTLRDPAIVCDGLMASAALPLIFDEIRIDGELFSDGGFYWGLPGKRLDNTPIVPLRQAGCDTVIVVCLSHDDLSIAPQQYPGMRVIPLVPRQSLGGAGATLDFSNQGAQRRIEQGYHEARELLQHLDMYVESEQRYRELWDGVARTAAQERELEAAAAGMDHDHAAVVRDIADFDKLVATDRFEQAMEAGDLDGTPIATAAELESSALFAELDREKIRTQVDRFLAQHQHQRQQVENAVLDALAALAPVQGRAAGARDEGALARLMGMLTGRNQKLAADNALALAEGQYALLRLVNAIQQQGATSLEFSCTLQNRLQAVQQEMLQLGRRHNQDMLRVYRSMAHIYGRLRDRLMQHGERLDALERQGRLHNWLLHPNRARFRGKRLADLPPTLRLATLANDFMHLTAGRWTQEELQSAQEMCYSSGLNALGPLRLGDFFHDLARDHVSAPALMSALVAGPGPGQSGAAASWLLDLRVQRLGGGVEQAVACWNYGVDTTLPAWDLLVELLYHLRAAGLAPIKAESQLSQLKARWDEQLAQLEQLADEQLLPAAFKREIAPVRSAVADFRLKVPLVGKFNAGKSSLLNRWLDQDVQAVALKANTSVPVEFHLAASGAEKLVVHWMHGADGRVVQETYADPYMKESKVQEYANGRQALHIERHCDLPALARYPDLVVVDTPGMGSSNVDHDTALAHYLGDAVLFILCANRGQVGQDELAFLRRQRQLGQDFSLLVCQEDLNNASEREAIHQCLAAQAELSEGQIVRGSSAVDQQLSGFEDLLAHVERCKAGLFETRFRPGVDSLLQRAEHLLAQSQAHGGDAALRQRAQGIADAIAALGRICEREQLELLADCQGPVATAVSADVCSFMRGRRAAYMERLETQQEVHTLAVADVQNAFQLAAERHFGARLRQTASAMDVELAAVAAQAPDMGNGDAAFSGEGSGLGGAAAGAFMGAAAGGASAAAMGAAGSAASSAAMAAGLAGSAVPGVGTVIGLVLGGIVGKLMRDAARRNAIAEGVNALIETLCTHITGQAPQLLENMARQAVADLQRQLEARLQTEHGNLAKIEEQRQAGEQEQAALHRRVQAALAQIRQALRGEAAP